MGTNGAVDAQDRFDLARFVAAQEGIYETALSELRQGRKRSHWMWFIFPQLEGLGSSWTARRYAIRSLEEARAYLGHPVLGQRLLESCRAILEVEGKSALEILGYPDDLKLRSSMTLFSLAVEGRGQREFSEVLAKFFNGEPDQRTIELLKRA